MSTITITDKEAWKLYVEPKEIEVCEWTEDGDDTWFTKCKEAFQFYEGGPKDNQFQFCPYCGRPVVERPYERPHEEE